MVIWSILRTWSNFVLADWGDEAPSSYFGINNAGYTMNYLLLGLLASLILLTKCGLIVFQSIRFLGLLHFEMLKRVIRAPINLFFDRIPIGRLINRFSSDLNAVAENTCVGFSRLLVCVFDILQSIFICAYIGTLWSLPILLCFAGMTFYFQQKYMKVQREVRRLSKLFKPVTHYLASITRSPVIGMFTETLNGLTSIRTYNKEKTFLKVIIQEFCNKV
mgnify:CR=1 FL=1